MADDKATDVPLITAEEVAHLIARWSPPESAAPQIAALVENRRQVRAGANTCTQPQAPASATQEIVQAVRELTGAVERLTLGASRIHARM